MKYLIIGNSAGGIGAAEAIREVDKLGSLAIVSDEPYPAYSRPLISKYLAEKCPIEKMLFRPADFYVKNNIQTLLGQKAEQLDVKKRTLSLASGEKISWERLMLAPGGLPIVPAMEGADRIKVFTFTTLDDARRIDQYLERLPVGLGQEAVVVGGGLIGVSVTEALVKRGIKVTIVEMKEHVLNTILDEEASAFEEEALKKSGVDVITGHTVAEVSSYSGETVTSVILDSGRPIPCRLVVVAIGVRPRTELVSGTGIEVNRGIVVDRHMATSSPDVYACGDAAEAYDFVYGENRLSPIWPNAYMGGRIAGLNMAGVASEYKGGTAMNSLKYFGVDAVSAGIVIPPDGSYEVLAAKHDHTYKKIVLKDGLIEGMVFVGDIEQSGVVFNLMKERVKVEGFKQALVADDFSLVSLPRELWMPHLGMKAPVAVQRREAGTENEEY